LAGGDGVKNLSCRTKRKTRGPYIRFFRLVNPACRGWSPLPHEGPFEGLFHSIFWKAAGPAVCAVACVERVIPALSLRSGARGRRARPRAAGPQVADRETSVRRFPTRARFHAWDEMRLRWMSPTAARMASGGASD